MDNVNIKEKVIKKSKNGLFKIVFSRLGLILLFFFIQICLIYSLINYLSNALPHIIGGHLLLSVIMVFYIVNMKMDSLSKITWMVMIVTLPVFGTLFFWFTRLEFGHRILKHKVIHLVDISGGLIKNEKIKYINEEVKSIANYINRSGHFPIYSECKVTYFPNGQDKFQNMLEQLEKAENFIFLEYFIIDEGLMWNTILEILERKVKEGVDVRVMYDGSCAFTTLPYAYPEKLNKKGIKCKMFAPMTPFISTHYNYRDHRKILVIDGKVAFNGGINLADEYINRIKRFGYWKDTAVMVEGEAVKSYTLMFLQMWNVSEEKDIEFEKYLNVPADKFSDCKGYVIPYGDIPLDDKKVGESVYMDILNRANKYVHIISPYLILDPVMESAIKFAAERGVDVKLILPGIPDKKTPYALAKTHYRSLMDSGVKIYEFTPGFTHAKNFVSDDIKAVVGTINLDYRSLYHHFECATYLYKVDCIKDIEDDFQDTLNKCKMVTYEDIRKEKITVKLTGFIMKILAPLM